MYVTAHAIERLLSRLTPVDAAIGRFVLRRLEGVLGEPGTVAYVLSAVGGAWYADDGSNGDTVVALVVDGSVETIYLRRSDQDMSARYFGASKVVYL